MSQDITPDEAIEECLRVGAHGISLGLAKSLQAERDAFRKRVEDLEADRDAEQMGRIELSERALSEKMRAETLQRRVDELEQKNANQVLNIRAEISRAESAEKERDEARNKTMAAMVDFSNRLIVIEAGMNRWSNESALEQMERLKTSIRAQFGVPELPQWPSQEFQDEYALTVSGLNANLAAAEKRLVEADQDRQDQVRRLVKEKADVEKRLASLTALTGEKELDEAMEICSLIRAGKPVPCGKGPADSYMLVLDSAVRSLRAKLAEWEKAFDNDVVAENKELREKLEEAKRQLAVMRAHPDHATREELYKEMNWRIKLAHENLFLEQRLRAVLLDQAAKDMGAVDPGESWVGRAIRFSALARTRAKRMSDAAEVEGRIHDRLNELTKQLNAARADTKEAQAVSSGRLRALAGIADVLLDGTAKLKAALAATCSYGGCPLDCCAHRAVLAACIQDLRRRMPAALLAPAPPPN